MHIFFAHAPRLVHKMRRPHGATYFLLEQFYFSGLSMAVAIALLLMYFLFGWTPARLQLEQVGLWYGPLLVWRQLIPLWLQRFNIRPSEERGFLWAGRILTIAAIPIYLLAFVGVLRNKRVTFKTTPKGDASGDPEDDALAVFKPHLALSGVIVAGMAVAIVLRHTSDIFLAWGCATSFLLSSFFAGKLCRRVVGGLRWRKIPAPLGQVESSS
jgi:cellulose synthase (UDP-forming)